jgi:hypothetical protein
MRKTKIAFMDSMDELESHYLKLERYDEAATLCKRLITTRATTSGPAASTRDMYHLGVALNQQKKFGESIPIIEQVVPMLEGRHRLDEDPEQYFAQHEIGAIREYVVALEGVGRIYDAKFVVGKALGIVEGLGEGERDQRLANLRAASGLFDTLKSKKDG